jgi:hypothetical protein
VHRATTFDLHCQGQLCIHRYPQTSHNVPRGHVAERRAAAQRSQPEAPPGGADAPSRCYKQLHRLSGSHSFTQPFAPAFPSSPTNTMDLSHRLMEDQRLLVCSREAQYHSPAGRPVVDSNDLLRRSFIGMKTACLCQPCHELGEQLGSWAGGMSRLHRTRLECIAKVDPPVRYSSKHEARVLSPVSPDAAIVAKADTE